MSQPTHLKNLTTREAIQDTLSRCILGLDTNDYILFATAFTPTAKFDLLGRLLDGLPQIKSGCFDNIETLDTTHFLTNTRIDVAGDDATTATVTAHAVAYHFPGGKGLVPGAKRFVTGCLYDFDMVRDEKEEGVWRIQFWRLRTVWTEGDVSVVTGGQE